MQYNFDEIINRKNTNSFKWDMVDSLYGEPDLLPLWVADMDFQSPQPVIKALSKAVQKGIFGYSACMESYYDAIVSWFQKKHSWNVKKDWIIYNSGVVPALGLIVQAFTEPGDNIIIQRPVYYPFSTVIELNDRNILNNSLLLNDNSYNIDFEDFENKAKNPKTKLFFLCNPHNPGGRTWSKDNLIKLAKICIKNDILIISDEIHCDLTLSENIHIPIASISPEIANNTITLTAASKTFNIAGLTLSNTIISNSILRKKFDAQLKKIGLVVPNQFGVIATEAAYKKGEEWLSQVIEYVEKNIDYMEQFFTENIPQIKVMKPQAGYLVWLNCKELKLTNTKLSELFIKKAKVALSNGYSFGKDEGSGFMRINVACPISTLKEALKKIEQAINN